MKEIRKRVSDLVVGDNVKGYGLLAYCEGGTNCHVVSLVANPGSSSKDLWPNDAEVTVLVPEKRWRVTFEVDDERVVRDWRNKGAYAEEVDA